jgi:hypothetical protein
MRTAETSYTPRPPPPDTISSVGRRSYATTSTY